MVEKKVWVFEGYCPRNSKLGVLLGIEVRRLQAEKPKLTSDDVIRKSALTNLGTRVGQEIRADDFLGLGPLEYFRKTESGRTIMPKLDKYYEELCREAQLLNLARQKAKAW